MNMKFSGIDIFSIITLSNVSKFADNNHLSLVLQRILYIGNFNNTKAHKTYTKG